MAQYSTQDFRKNLKIEIEGEPYVILEANHVKPGKGVAFVKTKYKSMLSGRVLDKNFRSGEKVDIPNLEATTMQYLYQDAEQYVFMDTTTYAQVHIDAAMIEEVRGFLKDNLEVDVLFYNERPISVDPPNFVELEIAQTDPGLKGDTAQGGSKPATLETGAVITVPLYIKSGEVVRVDTRTGAYVERVNR